MPRILVLTLLLFGCAHSTPSWSIVSGTLRDSSTGRPIQGLYVWPLYHATGAVTDSLGHFRLPNWAPFVVRACNETNLAVLWTGAARDSVIALDTMVSAPRLPCEDPPRAPWVVDESDTVQFRGHFISSWEGGGLLMSCAGKYFEVDKTEPGALWAVVNAGGTFEGKQTFLRLRGRVVAAGFDLTPPGPVFLIGTVDEVRPAKPDDCH
jgi:hypothetical protein